MSGGNEKGFTLVEVIVAIVIGAIIISMAGVGIVNVTNGLLLTKQNAANALKAQVAMMRLDKELHIVVATPTPTGTATSFTFTNDKGGGSASYTLSQAGNSIVLVDNVASTTDTLINNVVTNSLTFGYRDTYNAASQTSWAASRKIIDISFTLLGYNGVQSTFNMRVRAVNL